MDKDKGIQEIKEQMNSIRTKLTEKKSEIETVELKMLDDIMGVLAVLALASGEPAVAKECYETHEVIGKLIAER